MAVYIAPTTSNLDHNSMRDITTRINTPHRVLINCYCSSETDKQTGSPQTIQRLLQVFHSLVRLITIQLNVPPPSITENTAFVTDDHPHHHLPN